MPAHREDACGDDLIDTPTCRRLPDKTSTVESREDSQICWVLAALKESRRIRKQQIVQRSGWSDSTASRALASLRDEGEIVFEGSRLSGYWRSA
jgi:hypothetical protein